MAILWVMWVQGVWIFVFLPKVIYYGRLIGREAKRGQTWTAAGFLVAYQLLQQPEQLKLIQIDAEDIFEKPF